MCPNCKTRNIRERNYKTYLLCHCPKCKLRFKVIDGKNYLICSECQDTIEYKKSLLQQGMYVCKKHKKTTVQPTKINTIIELLDNEYNISEIAKKLHLSRNNITGHLSSAGINKDDFCNRWHRFLWK